MTKKVIEELASNTIRKKMKEVERDLDEWAVMLGHYLFLSKHSKVYIIASNAGKQLNFCMNRMKILNRKYERCFLELERRKIRAEIRDKEKELQA